MQLIILLVFLSLAVYLTDYCDIFSLFFFRLFQNTLPSLAFVLKESLLNPHKIIYKENAKEFPFDSI